MSIQKTTTDLTTLKINYLTQAMFENALGNDEINDNELYLTPNDSVPLNVQITTSITMPGNGMSARNPSAILRNVDDFTFSNTDFEEIWDAYTLQGKSVTAWVDIGDQTYVGCPLAFASDDSDNNMQTLLFERTYSVINDFGPFEFHIYLEAVKDSGISPTTYSNTIQMATISIAPALLNYTTTAPTAANTVGLKIALLDSEPATKYSGWIYLIQES